MFIYMKKIFDLKNKEININILEQGKYFFIELKIKYKYNLSSDY